jgi:hypothetical protein
VSMQFSKMVPEVSFSPYGLLFTKSGTVEHFSLLLTNSGTQSGTPVEVLAVLVLVVVVEVDDAVCCVVLDEAVDCVVLGEVVEEL